MNKVISHYLGSLVLSLLLLTISVFIHWIGYLLVIYCIAAIISRSFRLSIVSALFFSVLTLLCLISICAFLMDFLMPTGQQFQILYHLLLLIPIFHVIFLFLNKKQQVVTISLIDRSTAISMLIAICGVLFLLAPVLRITNPSEYVYFLSSGEDNASHVAMLNYNIEHQSPPYFNHSPTGLTSSLNIYPQGTHSFAAFTYWSFVGNDNPSPLTLLRIYSVLMSLLGASLVFIFSLLIQKVIHNKHFDYVITIIFSTLTFMGVVIFLVIWGFITQIAALVLLLSILFLALSVSKESISRRQLNITLSIFGLLVTGVTFSWYLITPVACFTLLPLLVRSFKQSRLTTSMHIGVVALLSSFPIILNFFSGKGSGAINEPGGVYKYEWLGISALAIGAIGSLYFIIKKSNKYRELTIKLFLIGSFALSIIIGSYQLYSTGTLLYYFYKSTYLIVMIGIFTLSYLSYLAVSAIKSIDVLNKSLPPLLLLVFFVFLCFIVKPVYPQVYLNNWFNHRIDPNSLGTSLDINGYSISHANDVFYIANCDVVYEYLLNRWTGALYLSHNKERDSLLGDRLNGNVSDNSLRVYRDKHPHTLLVYDSSKCP